MQLAVGKWVIRKLWGVYSPKIHDGNSQEKWSVYNSTVHNTRARVESLFGKLPTKFEALDNPWRESKYQLDYMVAFACGLNNKLILIKIYQPL